MSGQAAVLQVSPRPKGQAAGLTNAEFRHAEADALPLGDESVDVVLSNDVFNLCPEKAKVLAELFRVLTPGAVSKWPTSCSKTA